MKPAKITARLGLALCLSFNLAATAPAGASVSQWTMVPPAAQTAHANDDDDSTAKSKDTLRFYNLHTGESLTLTRSEGDPVGQRVNWFLRDYRRGTTIKMDPELLDLLADIKHAIKQRHPQMSVRFNVVSSYRSPETNAALRAAGGGQAQHSLHMEGKAMDIRVPGVTTVELRDIVTCLKQGGVGYYAEDNFVHVDTGRVRYWPSHDYLTNLSCKTPRPLVATTVKIRHPRRG